MRQITKSSDVLTKKNVINRISDIPGGVSLVLSNLVAGNIVPEATPLTAPSGGKRTVCKQATLLAGSTTTVFRVKSGTHHFKTGDIIMQADEGAAYEATVVREAGTDGDGVLYDTITVGTALESGAEGTAIYESSAEGASAGDLENVADAILKTGFIVPSGDQIIYMADAHLRADVVEGSIGALYLATLDVNEVKY